MPKETTAKKVATKTGSKKNGHGSRSVVPKESLAVASTSTLPAPVAASVAVAIETLEKDTMDASWYSVLEGEFSKPYFGKVRTRLDRWTRILTCTV